MRHILFLFSALTFFALAQPAPMSLTEAIALAPEFDVEVISARADLAAAERELARTEADPLALRLPLVQAQQALANAQGDLDNALLAARATVSDAYYVALEADEVLILAEMRQAIAATSLEATQIRYEAGAATELELERAQNDLLAAERSSQDARQSKNLAYSELASLIGKADNDFILSTDFALDDIPSLAEALSDLANNSQLRRAEQTVEIARIQLESVDNAFSAQAEIETARDALQNAEIRLADTRRSLELSIRQSYNLLLAAQGRLENANANAATSAENLEAQRLRFEAGSISLLAYEQAKLDHANIVAQANSARYDLAQALTQLKRSAKGANLP